MAANRLSRNGFDLGKTHRSSSIYREVFAGLDLNRIETKGRPGRRRSIIEPFAALAKPRAARYWPKEALGDSTPTRP